MTPKSSQPSLVVTLLLTWGKLAWACKTYNWPRTFLFIRSSGCAGTSDFIDFIDYWDGFFICFIGTSGLIFSLKWSSQFTSRWALWSSLILAYPSVFVGICRYSTNTDKTWQFSTRRYLSVSSVFVADRGHNMRPFKSVQLFFLYSRRSVFLTSKIQYYQESRAWYCHQ